MNKKLPTLLMAIHCAVTNFPFILVFVANLNASVFLNILFALFSILPDRRLGGETTLLLMMWKIALKS